MVVMINLSETDDPYLIFGLSAGIRRTPGLAGFRENSLSGPGASRVRVSCFGANVDGRFNRDCHPLCEAGTTVAAGVRHSPELPRALRACRVLVTHGRLRQPRL